jgi:hypothetical protein
MPKRRADANSRRFFDEFASVRASRLRATGVIDPAKPYALTPVGKRQKPSTPHTRISTTAAVGAISFVRDAPGWRLRFT